jgi:hypothetical protein
MGAGRGAGAGGSARPAGADFGVGPPGLPAPVASGAGPPAGWDLAALAAGAAPVPDAVTAPDAGGFGGIPGKGRPLGRPPGGVAGLASGWLAFCVAGFCVAGFAAAGVDGGFLASDFLFACGSGVEGGGGGADLA